MAVVPAPSMATNTKNVIGSVPPRRLTKEQLAKTHNQHLKKQDLSPDAPRPVKQPILSEAYPASTKSIKELDIVSQDSFVEHNYLPKHRCPYLSCA